MNIYPSSSLSGLASYTLKNLRNVFSVSFLFALLLASVSVSSISELRAQEAGMQPGEAFSTRFSGIRQSTGSAGQPLNVIDLQGIVGSIVDVRNPQVPPQGQHWIDEPQRAPASAAEIGQVFGIALDDASPPNIYLTATAAFGLHRLEDNSDWMPGMWGPDGGPGTVYKLDATDGYRPQVFARITLEGRPNSGPALGNIAYDSQNKQLFVSDLETGMIHRLSIEDGADLGHFDHGLEGRSVFYDANAGAMQTLPVAAFDPASSARFDDCEGDFSKNPQCWNVANFKRRVWGLGVNKDEASGKVRLYYGTWGTDGLGDPTWNSADDDARNWIWSIAIADNGAFDLKDVRREFALPDFGPDNKSVEHAPSDIAFSCASIMLVAERGGLRNLGLEKEEPFSRPQISRVLQYSLDENNNWRVDGRYDVGFSDRANEGTPHIRSNGAGGVDWGYGYTEDWSIDLSKQDKFVWMSGDKLCSRDGPCFDAETGEQTDSSEVHGIQGTPTDAISSLNPDGALAPYQSPAYPPVGPSQSYMIDLDQNIDPATGQVIFEELERNDATMIGDVEILKICGAAPQQAIPFVPGPVHDVQISAFHRKYESNYHNKAQSLPCHDKSFSHDKYGSHAKNVSHYRSGSHNLNRSHLRYGSHSRLDSHYRLWSHTRRFSHKKYASHDRRRSHLKYGSHDDVKSHYRLWSHNRRLSHGKYYSHDRKRSHLKYGSHDVGKSHYRLWSHNRNLSHGKYYSHDRKSSHRKYGSHDRNLSHRREGSHDRKLSHRRTGSHNKELSHRRTESHDRKASHRRSGSHDRKVSHRRSGSHDKKASHRRTGSHNKKASHRRTGSHDKKASHRRSGSHDKKASHRRSGSHDKKASHRRTGSHNKKASHRRSGSHDKKASHRRTGSHNKKASHRRSGSHDKKASHRRTGSHDKKASHRRTGSHNKKASHRRSGSHDKKASHRRTGSHDKKASHRRTGSHNKKASHRRKGSHDKNASHRRTGSHDKKQSHKRTGSHNKSVSHKRTGSHNKKASNRRDGKHNRKQSKRKQNQPSEIKSQN